MAPNLPSSAHQTIALARVHRSVTKSIHRTPGGAFKPGHGVRRRIPKQEHPLAIEASFAKAIIDHVVDTMRSVMKPIMEALPHLLPDDKGERQDADVAEDLVDTRPALTARAFKFTAGLPIVIENPRGSMRHWVDSNGEAGSTRMKHDYGYIAGTVGADGEDVDVYRGRVADPRVVYIIDQMSKADGFKSFDEQKIMIGYPSADAARAAYLEQYNDPRFLGSMMTMPIEEFRKHLSIPGAIPSRPPGSTDMREDAADTAQARRLFERARGELERRALNPARLDDLVSRFGAATSAFQRAQLARQVRAALGIDLVASDRTVPTLIDRFTHEGVARIRSLGDQSMSDMERMVAHAFTTGRRAEDVANDIAERYDISERHARFIARDQIGTLTGQVNAARQQAIGITRFTWRTVGDERVREEHEILNNEVFSYDDLPDPGLPGEDYNCRCSAEPEFSDILDAVRDDD